MDSLAAGAERTTFSIIIPVLNEEGFVEKCLADVLDFDLPPDTDFEVLVLDGGSADGTKDIVRAVSSRDARVQLLDNPERWQSVALNIGIRKAKGAFILRLDAHSSYPKDYLRINYETARRTGAHNVGGFVRTMARTTGLGSRIVQALTSHRFGIGGGAFRAAPREGEVDTVPYGFFPRSLFDAIGLFDERLERAQDYEFNRRIRAAGGTVWMNPAIHLEYFQSATFRQFIAKQYFREAPYNAYLWYCAPYAFTIRHAITAVFALGVITGAALAALWHPVAVAYLGVLALYAILAVLSSVQQAMRYRSPDMIAFLPPSFFVYHFLHGVGVLHGLILLAVGRSPVQKKKEPWPSAGRRCGLPRRVRLPKRAANA